MFTIKIEGLDEVKREIGALAQQAAKNAVNKVAAQLVPNLAENMSNRFDRPTKTTIKSFRVSKWATKEDPTAIVQLKDKPLGNGNPLSMDDLIHQEFNGGGRIQKNYERTLINAGFMARDEYTVPGAKVKLNAYGNISSALMAQILAQIGAIRGFSTKRNRKPAMQIGEMFWSTGKGVGMGKTLRKGVWMRVGRGVEPILLVVKAPKYKCRIDIVAVANKTVAEFQRNS